MLNGIQKFPIYFLKVKRLAQDYGVDERDSFDSRSKYVMRQLLNSGVIN